VLHAVAPPVAASDVAVVAQALLTLALIVVGAEVFVQAVGHTAETIGLLAELVALILAPWQPSCPRRSTVWAVEDKALGRAGMDK
jgi:Ca2+/Na+ antiporter